MDDKATRGPARLHRHADRLPAERRPRQVECEQRPEDHHRRLSDKRPERAGARPGVLDQTRTARDDQGTVEVEEREPRAGDQANLEPGLLHDSA